MTFKYLNSIPQPVSLMGCKTIFDLIKTCEGFFAVGGGEVEVCFCLFIETVGISDSKIVLEQNRNQVELVQKNELSVKDGLSFCLNCSGMISGQNTHR